MKILENLNVLAAPLHAYVAAATQPTRSLVMVDLIANLPPPRAMCGFHIPLGRRQRLLQPRNIQRNAVRRLCTLEAPTFAQAIDVHHVKTEGVELRKANRIKLPDAIIWATAQLDQRLLVTRNSKDFAPTHADVRIPYVV